jgi:hypothetical protein
MVRPLIVVRAFSHPHEAQLACSALQASGIEAIIADAHIVTANWLLSNAVGGVKVLVPAEDADAAREILDSTAVVQASDRPETNDATAIVCPRCGSGDVAPVTRGKRLAVLSWLIVSFPLFPVRHRMRCQNCGAVLHRSAGDRLL